jgi:hypothetical protein
MYILTFRGLYIVYWVRRIMIFNATFGNISVIAWRSVIWLEETGVPGENHRPVASH